MVTRTRCKVLSLVLIKGSTGTALPWRVRRAKELNKSLSEQRLSIHSIGSGLVIHLSLMAAR